MELTLSIVIVLCVTFASAADDLKTDSDINFELPVSEDVKQYISKVVSTMASKHISDIQALQEKIDSQEKRINILESEQKIHTSIVRELEKKNVHVEDEMKICSCECDKKSDEQKVSDMTEYKNPSARRKGNEQGSFKGYGTRIRRASVENKIAFFATMTPSSEHLGKDQDIVFDHEVTNIGGAYNANHGTFIAPVAGTYVFSVTLSNGIYFSTHGTYGHVVVNGSVVAKLRVLSEQSSQTIVVNLDAGDDVAIQNTVTDRGFDGDRYTTFSGYLLYENATGGVVDK